MHLFLSYLTLNVLCLRVLFVLFFFFKYIFELLNFTEYYLHINMIGVTVYICYGVCILLLGNEINKH